MSRPRSPKTLYERFRERFKEGGPGACWTWVPRPNNQGYGTIIFDRQSFLAHRLSWEVFIGEIPDRKFVLHRCDNRICVNPGHLFIGTHAENMADRNRKGRQAHPIGEKSGLAKLSERDAKEILVCAGTQKQIARRFGIAQATVSKIRRGETWAHLSAQKEGAL